jgi:RNA polymerase sigma factor (sigma-70 family)
MEQCGEGQPNDAAVIEASFDDPDRFGLVVERHFPAIYGYLARRVGPEAEDLAADAFAIAFRSRANFDLACADARPWLHGIATNVLRRHRRSEIRQIAAYARAASRLGAAAPQNSDDGIGAQIDDAAAVARVAGAFGQLDADHRDALYLVAVAEVSYGDAAEALGLPVGTLHSRVARARARLRDLADYRGQQPDTTSLQTRE